MPELPEVEAAARVLRRATLGRSIVRLRVLHASLKRRVSNKDLARLRGKRVARVERRGKHQLLRTAGGPTVMIHFRMTGDWEVSRVGEPDAPYARAVLELDDGTRVSLVDPRALSTVTVHDDVEAALPALGPEATDASIDVPSLAAALARRRGPIKPALLDQRILAGLGNIYAAEALWRARIDPRAPARELPPERLTSLLAAAREVLRRASRSPARYLSPERTSASRFAVYDREGKPCRRCRTPIARLVQAGRSTYFCPTCQT